VAVKVASVQRRFVFIFGICIHCTVFLQLLSLASHLFKNALAGQFGFASALAEPNSCMSFE
jgi:hypothetical protein